VKTLERRVGRLEEAIKPEKEEFLTFVLVYKDRGEIVKTEELQTDIPWRGDK
jgi:hypothetical protein